MRIYYTVVDHSDGSYGIEFFENPDLIDFLENTFDHYPMESSGYFDCDNFKGEIRTLDDVRKQYEEDQFGF